MKIYSVKFDTFTVKLIMLSIVLAVGASLVTCDNNRK